MGDSGLLDRQLVLVTGKGGVGKSTCAAALALAASRAGKRTLLCELGARCASASLLGAPQAGHQPQSLHGFGYANLSTCWLQPQAALQQYLIEHLKIRRLVRLATETRVLARLWEAAPSVNEMALLNSVYQLAQARDGERRRYDCIIMDMPATGHALSMLGVPQGVVNMVRIGPLAERARIIDRLLHDSERVTLCIVTLAEELPVQESKDLDQALRNRIGLEPSHLFVNCLLPEVLHQDERELLEHLTESLQGGPAKPLVDVASEAERRRSLQQGHLAELAAALPMPRVDLLLETRKGPELVRVVAERLSESLSWQPGSRNAKASVDGIPGSAGV